VAYEVPLDIFREVGMFGLHLLYFVFAKYFLAQVIEGLDIGFGLCLADGYELCVVWLEGVEYVMVAVEIHYFTIFGSRKNTMKQLLFGIFLLTLIGCSRFKTGSSTPSGIISQDSMIGILVDIHVADAVADQRFGADKPNRAFINAMYEQIYKNHHITAAQYKESYKYYETHPAEMDKMYEQIITEISKREADIKKAK
jgi:hypothetical protein